MEEKVKLQDGQQCFERSFLSFLVFIGISVVVFFRIGCQLVMTAWSAVQLTGRTNAVGEILFIVSVTNLVCSPVIGKLIDTFKKKRHVIICGHLGGALACALPLAVEGMLLKRNSFVILAIIVVLASISGFFANGAMDYYTKIYIPIAQRVQKLALLSAITQVALLLGTAVGSIILTKASFSQAFLVISVCNIVAAAACLFFLPAITIKNPENIDSNRNMLLAELYLYFKYPTLFAVAGCAALVFSIGQITNTLLPALIYLSLKLNSTNYAMVEVAWSIGAFCVSVFLASKVRRSVGPIMHDLWLIALMACLLIVIPWMAYFPMLLAMHLLLGIGFAAVRIRSETRFLLICPMGLLGRFRANSLFMTNLIGLIIFAMPTLNSNLTVTTLYLLLAVVILVTVIILSLFGPS